MRHGTILTAASVTLRQAADEWMSMAEAGLVLNRSGDPYKPSVLRAYEQSLRLRVVPALGAAKLGDIRRSDVQRVVNRMIAEGVGPSTIRNSLMPLRAIYRYALSLDEVAVNPTSGVQLPRRPRQARSDCVPAEAGALLEALPERERALWATAMFAGLRSGELQALTDDLVDLDKNLIEVRWSWDPKAGRVAPKNWAGRRMVPVPAELRRYETAQVRPTAAAPQTPSPCWKTSRPGRRASSDFALDTGRSDRLRRKAGTPHLPRQVTAMDERREQARDQAG